MLARVAVAATAVITASHACECDAVHAPVRIEKETTTVSLGGGGGKRSSKSSGFTLQRDSSVLRCVRRTRELAAWTALWGACNFTGTFGTRLWDVKMKSTCIIDQKATGASDDANARFFCGMARLSGV